MTHSVHCKLQCNCMAGSTSSSCVAVPGHQTSTIENCPPISCHASPAVYFYHVSCHEPFFHHLWFFAFLEDFSYQECAPTSLARDPYSSVIGHNGNGWCPGTHRNETINVPFLVNNISHETSQFPKFCLGLHSKISRNALFCHTTVLLATWPSGALTPNGCLAKSLTASQQTFEFPSNLPTRRLVMSRHLISTTLQFSL